MGTRLWGVGTLCRQFRASIFGFEKQMFGIRYEGFPVVSRYVKRGLTPFQKTGFFISGIGVFIKTLS